MDHRGDLRDEGMLPPPPPQHQEQPVYYIYDHQQIMYDPQHQQQYVGPIPQHQQQYAPLPIDPHQYEEPFPPPQQPPVFIPQYAAPPPLHPTFYEPPPQQFIASSTTVPIPEGNIYTRLEDHAVSQGRDSPRAIAFEKSLPDRPRAKKPFMDRYVFCCGPKKNKHRMICCGVILTVLIIVAVLLGLYIPRYPSIKVYAINLANLNITNTPYLFTDVGGNLNNLNLQMNLSMQVGTYNPNRYDLNVDRIDLTALMMANTTVLNNPLLTNSLTSFGELVKIVGPVNTVAGYTPSFAQKIGTATYGSILFPAQQWTNYTMIFQLNYTPDPNVGLLKDPTIMEMASACGITSRGGAMRTMRIQYSAASSIGALKSLGFTPTLDGDLGISCPFTTDQIEAVIHKVQGGQSAFEAIQDVFGSGGVPGPSTTAPLGTSVDPPSPPPPSPPPTGNGGGSSNGGSSSGGAGNGAGISDPAATTAVQPTDGTSENPSTTINEPVVPTSDVATTDAAEPLASPIATSAIPPQPITTEPVAPVTTQPIVPVETQTSAPKVTVAPVTTAEISSQKS
ncbi:hypothetical protein HDU98_009458 [Podochytrium sp. JEL0797]|nr:hypothetical protein HDU98_009458 [Podochytrium sp. JEL0797]